MTNIKELSKIENINGIWTVQILSAAIGQWIVQGEWTTKQEAETDRQNWL